MLSIGVVVCIGGTAALLAAVLLATGLLTSFEAWLGLDVSKLELKSVFLSLYCCTLLKLDGTSFMGLPSIKLAALEAQF
jgi:hypothetical protein